MDTNRHEEKLAPEREEIVNQLSEIQERFDEFVEAHPYHHLDNKSGEMFQPIIHIVDDHLSIAVQRAQSPGYNLLEKDKPENCERMVNHLIGLYESLILEK